jgi:chemosensory pili system protein ChpA (sensor histidine kinase/response regulator)
MDHHEDGEQQMLSVFLMEAWDTLATIEEALGRDPGPAEVMQEWLDPLLVVAHRLGGSAALYGFPEISSLAHTMQEILEQAAHLPLEDRHRTHEALSGVVAQIRDALDAVGAAGSDAIGALAAFAADETAPTAVPSPDTDAALRPDPAPAAPQLPTPGGSALLESLTRFFAENTEILEYFGPEAAEHLETMTDSLLLLEKEGPSKGELGRLFRAVHTLKGAAYTVGFTVAGDVAHRIEDLLAAVQEDLVPFSPAVIEAVFAGIDTVKTLVAGPAAYREDVPTMVERALEGLRALAPQAGAGDVPPGPVDQVESPGATAADLEPKSTLVESRDTHPEGVGRHEPADVAAGGRPSIRVNLDRLDSLMGLVGELVIARSRLERRLGQFGRVAQLLLLGRGRIVQVARELEAWQDTRPLAVAGPPLRSGASNAQAPDEPREESVSQLLAGLDLERYDTAAILARGVGEIAADISEVHTQLAELIRSVSDETSQIQRVTGGLRNEVTRARMVPIGTLFARFARQVRETAKATGKQVVLHSSGETVEVDNTIIQRLADPLLHLVRNAIVHGIEAEEERRTRGKPVQGTVYLNAYHQGGAIYVEVEDDGRGIDAAALKEHAALHGFLPAHATTGLTEREALDLIFLPGFSTSASVTTEAGRGVGMDVVRTDVRSLNGEISVETEVGVGTRFTIKLPLTVIIADALFVKVGNETLAVPLTAIQMIRTLTPGDIHVAGRAEMIQVGEELIDLVRLDRLLELPQSTPRAQMPVIVMRSAGRSVAVTVDELVGKEEIVIKSLGGFLEGVGPFAGATISGEGQVILLLDPVRLSGINQDLPDALGGDVGSPSEDVGTRGGWHGTGPRRVLLVDDSISVRKFVGQMLQRAGFDVVTAIDGADALTQIGDTVFDAVITDLEMPRINGYELIADLRRRSSTRDIPIVVLTTRAAEKHANAARRLGVKHYVTKPVDEQSFVSLIQSIASSASAGASAGAGVR